MRSKLNENIVFNLKKIYVFSWMVFLAFSGKSFCSKIDRNALYFFAPTVYIDSNKAKIKEPLMENLVTLDTPSLVSPGNRILADTIFSTQPVFTWRKVPDAQTYLLRIYKKVSEAEYNLIFNSAFYVVIVDTAFKMLPNILKVNETYLWYIQALNDTSISRWSPPFKFTIKSAKVKKIVKPLEFKIPKPEITNVESDATEEVFLTFKYGNVVNIPIIAYLKREKLYLPVKTIFDALKIFYEDNPEARTLNGFFTDKNKTYKLDFANKKFKFNNRKVPINENEFYLEDTGDDYYLTPAAFDKLFGMKFSVNYRKLILRLNSKILFPVYERELTKLNFQIYKQKLGKKSFGKFFPSETGLLNLGFLDYNFSGTVAQNSKPYTNYYFGVSSNLLGGEAHISFNGSAIAGNFINDRIDWNWRYGMFNKYLTQITLGNFYAQGLSSYNLRGISISNEPLEARRLFSKYKIHSKTHPDWQVELYKNNLPVDYVTADESGNYEFEIPLEYGMTYLKIRQLGTKGEVYEEEKLLHIPYELLPPGEVNYHLNIGETPFTKIKIARADVEYGINKNITDKTGFDYVHSGSYKRGIFYNALTAKFSTEYLANFIAAPGAFYKFDFSGIYPSLSSFDVSYTFYGENSFFNPTGIKNNIFLNFYHPVNFGEFPLNLFATGEYLTFRNGGDRKNIRFGINSTLNRFSPTITYEYFNSGNRIADFTRSLLSAGFFYSLPQLPGIFRKLYGNVFSSKLIYNIQTGKVENLFFSLSTNLFSNARLQLVHNENLLGKISTTSLQLVVDFSFTRSTTTIFNNQFTQNFSGSLGYDVNYKKIHSYNRFQQGKSAAVINCFIDENGNGKYDTGEKNIEGIKLNLNNLSRINYDSAGKIIVSELIPYSLYHAKLLETQFENPLLVPKFKEFSFIADPNKYKRIDIPFYFAGEINGSVRKQNKNEVIPLPGLKITIENKQTGKTQKISSFSDGSFYYFGLLPGKYRIYIDKKLLKKINLRSTPEFYEIEIKSVKSGDYHDNLNFVLK